MTTEEKSKLKSKAYTLFEETYGKPKGSEAFFVTKGIEAMATVAFSEFEHLADNIDHIQGR